MQCKYRLRQCGIVESLGVAMKFIVYTGDSMPY